MDNIERCIEMKKHMGLKIFGIIVSCIVVFMAVINIIPPQKTIPSC